MRFHGPSLRAAAQDESAAPDAFFERWCDIETHPEWAPSMEYFRLEESFAVGAVGVSRSRAGEENRFQVTVVDPPGTYADTTFLDGANLTVHHHAEPDSAGGAKITVRAYLDGADAATWAGRMGDDVQHGIEGDVAALATMLEGRG